ncbi:MAG TPA: DNA translocase FtsK [Geminicoccus sp.]|uniref:DNA translocase FtsK n=1 Tax=Geminicoccus sp. TaxID=2024832 RepID=UPI002E356AE2|nr:DNA translocase FtsK [Geminicoccus sp.]HEX2528763.1 DNA translocase FtsK [Geminicoccus sp.]
MATTVDHLRGERPFAGLVATMRRLVVGLGWLAVAGLLAIAVWGFDPADPSFNTATSAAPANPLDLFGAYAADLVLQLFGVAVWLPIAVFAVWGIRLVADKPFYSVLLPPTALPMALLGLCAFLATQPQPDAASWPLRVGLGGFVGRFLHETLHPMVGGVLYGWGAVLLTLAAGILAFGIPLTDGRWKLFGLARPRSRRHHLERKQQPGPSFLARLSLPRLPAIGGRTIAGANVVCGLIAQVRGRVAALFRTNEPEKPVRPRRPGVRRPEPDSYDDDTNEPEQELAKPTRGRGRTASAPPEPVQPDPRDYMNEPEDDDEDEDDLIPFPPPAKGGGGRASIPAPAAKTTVAVLRPSDPARTAASDDGFELPDLEFLTPPKHKPNAAITKEKLHETSRQLETVLDDFGVRGEITDAKPGPVVTLYELEPAPGTRAARVISLADDIARSLCALSVRVATVPGRNVIGVELPNDVRETVFLKELLDSPQFTETSARLALALGKDISGKPIMVDLARMPHLLIAGTTGAGKSVAINAMILSLLYRLTPKQCRIIMIDPKVIELSVYDHIPHLLAPVVTEPGKAVVALKWVVRQMDERYRLMSHLGVRDIFAFNRRIEAAKAQGETLNRRVRTGFEPNTGAPTFEDQPIEMKSLPLIVVIVDEVADLMLTAGKEIENAIQRLSQKARAAGIHLIVATQRPSVDVLTGVIKANLPSRISFRVSSKIDSRTILSEPGAEQLLGQGDMLFMMPGDRILRIHGPLVTDDDVARVVTHLKAQGEPDYVDAVTDDVAAEEGGSGGDGNGPQGAMFGSGGEAGGDAMYQEAIKVVARDGKASTSYLQRKLNIGYNTAAKLIERMEQDRLITPADHVGRRQVLMGRGGVDGDEPTEF